MDRRDFLRCGLGGAWLASHSLRASAQTRAGAAALARTILPAKSIRPAVYDRPGMREALGRVAVAHDLIPSTKKPASNRDGLDTVRMRERLDAGMAALFGSNGWQTLFDRHDTVAVKINGLASPALSPRPEIAASICAALEDAGVEPGRIILWDRTTREVERSGFRQQLESGSIRAYGTDALRGGGYSREIHACGAVGSQVSRILTQYASALINLGVLKDHDLSGLSAGMKNLYGVIHNPNRYHADGCDPFVAEVAGLEPVRARLRLTVIDAVFAQAEGGPAYSPDWIWPCDRVLMGIDPVACDFAAWKLLEAERARRGLPSLLEAGRNPGWIQTAAYLGLGVNDDAGVIDV